MAQKKKVISFSIDALLADQLEKLAEAQRVSRSALVEGMIRSGMDSERMSIRALANPVLKDVLLKVLQSPGVLKEMARAMVDPLSGEQIAEFHRQVGVVGPQVMDTAKGVVYGKRRRSRRKGKGS